MNYLKGISLILPLVLTMFSCQDKIQEETEVLVEFEVIDPASFLDFISEDAYYENDIFQDENSGIYGVWRSFYRIQEGINGSITSSNDFDYLVVKPNAVFGIIKNDELINFGNIELVDDQNNNLVNFICDCDNNETNFLLLQYNKVEIELNSASEVLKIIDPDGETFFTKAK